MFAFLRWFLRDALERAALELEEEEARRRRRDGAVEAEFRVVDEGRHVEEPPGT